MSCIHSSKICEVCDGIELLKVPLMFEEMIQESISLVTNWDSFVAAVAFAGAIAIFVAVVELLIDANSSSLQRIIKNRKSATIDILSWFFHYSPLFSIVLAASTFGVLNVVKLFLHAKMPVLIGLEDGLAKFFLLFIAYDFLGYWGHRLMHSSEFTWKFHEFHHSARTFNIFTVHRVHPVDSAVVKFFQTFVVLAIGATTVDVVWFTVLTLLLGTVKHSNLIVNYPKPFNIIVQSPGQHWIHHSENSTHYNKNFGEILQIWDFIFRTHCDLPNEELKHLAIGTPDTKDFHDSFSKLFFWPYKSVVSKTKRSIKSALESRKD